MEMNELKHGLFFHHVLEGLRGKAKDSENEVTVLGLAQYAMRQVKRAGVNQTPVFKGEVTDGILVRFLDSSPALLADSVVLEKKGDIKPKLSQAPTGLKANREFSNSLHMKMVYIPSGKF